MTFVIIIHIKISPDTELISVSGAFLYKPIHTLFRNH